MDPIAHTLVGAALAQAGLRNRTRYATAALLIGANLPDVDAFTMLGDPDLSLLCRRGWTHGVLAMAALPAALTGTLLLVHRMSGRRGRAPNAGALLLLSYLAFLTHPLLDWLNNYGVRLLMPFDGRWFYGDAVFILDPWIWLMLGGAVFLFFSKRRASLIAWMGGIPLIAALVWLGAPAEFIGGKLLWTVAVAVVLTLRLRRSFFDEHSAARLARLALAATTLYISLMVVSARLARDWVYEELSASGMVIEQWMVGPLPVTPFLRDVVVETPEGYRYGILTLSPWPSLQLAERAIPKPDDTPTVQAALRSPKIRGFMNWARFPFVEIESDAAYVMDARFVRQRTGSFGTMVIRPRPSGSGSE